MGYFDACLFEHLWSNVHADHACSRAGMAQNCNCKVSCTCSQIERCFFRCQGQIASRSCSPVAIEPKTHQEIHQIIDTSDTTEEALYVGTFATHFTKLFF